jgi:glutamate dehydrogenase
MSSSTHSPAPPSLAHVAATVDAVCEHLERTADAHERDLLCDFTRRFFTKAPRSLVQDRDVEQLAALAVATFKFFRLPPGAGARVRVTVPEEEGWSAPVTVLRATLRDRPFVVDTIREYLAGENLPIAEFLHPVIGVGRRGDGTVVGVAEPGGGDEDQALVYCELSRIDDIARREAICADVETRLNDVVAATEDFPAMVEALEATVAQVEENAARFPEREQEMREVAEFLHWLRGANFVFLGFRSYRISDDATQVLRLEEGSGLGILRREERSAYVRGVPLGELTEALRRRVTGGPVLIINKTNAESTVHRRARMDYIGIKMLDNRGKVVGERRFLGLFTSKAYADHADTIPILRRKLERILESSARAAGLARLQGDDHPLQLHAQGGPVPGLRGGAGARGADAARCSSPTRCTSRCAPILSAAGPA